LEMGSAARRAPARESAGLGRFLSFRCITAPREAGQH
jgi:hypothetical protein